ncbi:hypothetical protein ACIBG5_26730 [Kribbella sp. NPDC050241]|uniref:hypothetical protein n=1 Tax=Kribbella sp. NPDC050241 TaxID=3364115 RepID=UPI00379464EC
MTPVPIRIGVVDPRLTRLHQRLTYDGLLEGLPNRRMNEAQLSHDRNLGYLVPVDQEPIEGFENYPFGGAARLPAIRVEAAFSSNALTGDPLQRSIAVVIWYQHGWARPIETPVLSHLASVEWASIALDEDL